MVGMNHSHGKINHGSMPLSRFESTTGPWSLPPLDWRPLPWRRPTICPFCRCWVLPTKNLCWLVRHDSPVQVLGDLANQTIALGEAGSATGYYLPLYDLYGLTLQKIEFAPTPATALEWVANGRVAAGAMAEDDFQQYRKTLEE